jgi:nitrile hydratase subunit alpha
MAADDHRNIPAAPEQRVAALESALGSRGLDAKAFVDAHVRTATEDWLPQNGARVVAKAWTDPAFRARLLKNGKDAVGELGITLPVHHRHLVALENTEKVHNLICCTQCSCTAYTVIGLPPDWYKDFEYRARAVREGRSVLREMGLDLPPEVELKVWDTSADTRYMVLPLRPAGTAGWSEEKLASIVTKDAMIGAARP